MSWDSETPQNENESSTSWTMPPAPPTPPPAYTPPAAPPPPPSYTPPATSDSATSESGYTPMSGVPTSSTNSSTTGSTYESEKEIPASAPTSPWRVPPVNENTFSSTPPNYGTTATPTPPSIPPSITNSKSSTQRSSRRAGRIFVGMIVVLGLFGLGFGARSIFDDESKTVISGSSVAAPTINVDPAVEPVAYAASVVSPSVVQIDVSGGLGSGVVYEPNRIMTNAHVVGNSRTVTVRAATGKTYQGRVIGTDAGTDIAVVQVDGLDVPVATLATEKPYVGQLTVAVGSPYGLTQTVTSGIVSALNRPVDNDKGVVVNMVQTDASINPGNSGGALANRSGQIIGINTAIFSQTGENTGIGFAIPISTAKRAADKLAAGETVTRAGLGLTGPSQARSSESGAYVQSVTPGGAADQAGIKAGDIIVSVDGLPIQTFNDLRGTISAFSPGDTVTVGVVRDGSTQEFKVVLGTLR